MKHEGGFISHMVASQSHDNEFIFNNLSCAASAFLLVTGNEIRNYIVVTCEKEAS